MKASLHIQQYFDSIEQGIQEAYEIAKAARKKGLDPETEVAIPLAKNMAESLHQTKISKVSSSCIIPLSEYLNHYRYLYTKY